jgi:hypothetical protein
MDLEWTELLPQAHRVAGLVWRAGKEALAGKRGVESLYRVLDHTQEILAEYLAQASIGSAAIIHICGCNIMEIRRHLLCQKLSDA